jgi:hypothetical protein
MLDPHIGKWPETLMRHLGFTEIVPKAPVPCLRDFIIEVERSDIPFIMRYEEEFKKRQEENIDSKADGKTSIPVDASRQHRPERASPGQSKKARQETTGVWYNPLEYRHTGRHS